MDKLSYIKFFYMDTSIRFFYKFMYSMITIEKRRELKLLINTVCFISVFLLLNLFQPLYADRMEDAAKLRKLIDCFLQSKDSDDAIIAVINKLGKWRELSKLPCTDDYAPGRDPDSEAILLEALDRAYSQLSLDLTSLENFFDYSYGRATLSNLSEDERYIALKTANHAMGEIKRRSAVTELSKGLNEKLADYGRFLIKLANGKENIAFRRLAIKGIVSIQNLEAIPHLKILAKNPESQNPVPVQKEALIALAHMRIRETSKIATELLKTTPNKELFGAASYALGQLQTKTALSALVANVRKNPAMNLHIRAAVSEYSDLVMETINSGEGDDLLLALHVLPHIQWKDKDLFKGKLIALLKRLGT